MSRSQSLSKKTEPHSDSVLHSNCPSSAAFSASPVHSVIKGNKKCLRTTMEGSYNSVFTRSPSYQQNLDKTILVLHLSLLDVFPNEKAALLFTQQIHGHVTNSHTYLLPMTFWPRYGNCLPISWSCKHPKHKEAVLDREGGKAIQLYLFTEPSTHPLCIHSKQEGQDAMNIIIVIQKANYSVILSLLLSAIFSPKDR